jgi:hypothetical protein
MDRRGTREFASVHDCPAYDWRVMHLWEPEYLEKSHLSAMSAHGRSADDQILLRSKVLSLTRLTMYRLKVTAEEDRLISPVCDCKSQRVHCL